MPSELPNGIIETADAAVKFAQQVRAFHRRRTDVNSPQRVADLTAAMERIGEAMEPLRTEIGRFPYGPQTVQAEKNRTKIREASVALQKERRKCWKMKRRSTSP